MSEIITPIMQARFGDDVNITHIESEVLRKRTKRVVLRYHIQAQGAGRRESLSWRIIGKAFTRGSGERGYTNMELLWQHGFSADAADGIRIPEPIAYLPELQLFFQEEVPVPPVKYLVKEAPQKAHFQQLARALAKLHRCPAALEETFGVKNHLLRCHPKHEFLSLACGKLTPLIDFIVEQAYKIEENLGDIPQALLHGDFHLGQVHLEPGRTWLIDFDTLSYGDPASDVGNLLVFLKDKARRKPYMYELIGVFLDEYYAIMGPEVAERVPLYEGLTHLRRACKCLRLQDPQWEEKAAAMVEKGAAAIGGLRRAG